MPRPLPSLALAGLLIGLLLVPARAAASPWTPEQGHGYAKAWLKGLWGFGYVDGDGDRVAYANYGELFLATYGHVGLTDRLAFVWQTDALRLFFLEDRAGDRTQTHATFGDPSVGLRLGALRRGRFALSLEAFVQVPLARSGAVQEVQRRETPNEPFGELVLGPGVVSLPVRVHAGWGGDGWYVAGALGYETRLGGFDDRLGAQLEAGRSHPGAWSWRVRASGNFVVREGSAARVESPSGQGNGVSYLGVAFEMDKEVRPGWFVGGVIEGGLGALRRQTGGPVFSLAVSRVW
ncbi:MAG: hypothetical protein AAGH15_17725 [Myxococcota bacterium]